jgi:outer membrane protein
MALIACAATALAQPTPPVMPKILELPLPPPVVLPPPPVAQPDVPNRPLTPDEAVALALHHQPSITAARAGVLGAQGRVQQNQSFLKPQLNVNANVAAVASNLSSGGSGSGGGTGGSGSSGGASTTTSYQLSGTLSQLIYDFDHTRDQVRQAMAQEKSAQAVLTKTQADLALQVKQAFYTYLQNVRLVKTSENNVRNRLGHFALAQARLKTGLGLPSDVVTAQTAYTQAVFDLSVARNNATGSRIALAQILGIDPRTPIEPANVGEPEAPDEELNALTDGALKARPEIVAAHAAIDAANFEILAARTVNKPSITGSASVFTRGEHLSNDGESLTIGVGMQWTPIDGGFTEGLVKQGQADLMTAQAQLETARLGVIADVAQAYLNVKSDEQKLGAANAEVGNAEEGLRLAQGRYRAGVAIFIEVLDAETQLDTANINAVNAQAALDQARAALAHAIGKALAAPAAPAPVRPTPAPMTTAPPAPK